MTFGVPPTTFTYRHAAFYCPLFALFLPTVPATIPVNQRSWEVSILLLTRFAWPEG